jgi:hypothetical protein
MIDVKSSQTAKEIRPESSLMPNFISRADRSKD